MTHLLSSLLYLMIQELTEKYQSKIFKSLNCIKHIEQIIHCCVAFYLTQWEGSG